MLLVVDNSLIDTGKIFRIKLMRSNSALNIMDSINDYYCPRLGFEIYFLGRSDAFVVIKPFCSFAEWKDSILKSRDPKLISRIAKEDYIKYLEVEFDKFHKGYEILLERWGGKTDYEEIKF